MSDQNQGGAQTDLSGAQVDDQADSAAKTIDPKEHERALKDMHRFKSDLKKTQQEYQLLSEKIKADEESKLAQQNEFKTLAERYKAELDRERVEKKQLADSFFLNQKMSAVLSAALKAGLRPDAEKDLELLSLDSVAIERTDHGRVIVHGADEYVQEQKKMRPHWFATKQVSNVNSGGGNGIVVGETITPEILYKIEKSGDKVKYKQALEQYLKQKNK